MPLTDLEVRNLRLREQAYRLTDGLGMYLEISPANGKYWRFKYRFAGQEKRLTLGVYQDVGPKEARVRRDEARRLLANGIDPVSNEK